MITLDDAKNKIQKEHSEKVVRICESPDLYIFGLDNGDEGYQTINKKTGEIGFMWIWEFAELYMDNKIKELELKTC